jgi:hypothetical protein
MGALNQLSEPKRLGLNEAARQLGRKGGKSKSDAKVAASRENGKKGGRPAKEKATDGYSKSNI